MTLTLASPEDIQALRARIGFFWMTPIRTVVLQLPGLSVDEARRWEVRLRRTLSACGCFSGATLALIALIAYPLAALGTTRDFVRSDWAVVGVGFGIVVSAAFIGKLGGLVTARLLLRRDLGQLLKRLQPHLYTRTEREN